MSMMAEALESVPGPGPADAGVTGPEASPPGGTPDNTPEREGNVVDVLSGGEADSPTPSGRMEPNERPGRPGARENAIPYSRVKRMLAEAEQRAEQRFRAQMEPVLSQLNPDAIRQGIAESMLTSLGYQPKKPEPQFVTQESFEKALRERDQRHQQELKRATEEQQATREIEAAKTSHKDLFEAYPDLEEDCANLWASRWAVENNVTMKQIVDYKVKKLREAIGKYNAAYAGAKEGDREVPTPSRPGSGSTPRQGKRINLGNDDEAGQAALDLLLKAGVR